MNSIAGLNSPKCSPLHLRRTHQHHGLLQISQHTRQRLFHLKQQVKCNLPLLFYTAVTESILTSCIIVWYSSLDSQSCNKLQRIVKKASKIIGTPLPSLDSLYHKRIIWVQKKSLIPPFLPISCSNCCPLAGPCRDLWRGKCSKLKGAHGMRLWDTIQQHTLQHNRLNCSNPYSRTM